MDPAPQPNKILIAVLIASIFVVFVGVAAFFVMTMPKNTLAPVAPVTTVPVVPKPPTTPPPAAPANQIKLVVLTPTDKSIVTTATVKVTGQTVPNADVSVNETETKANAQGNFSVTIKLDEGDNPIVIDVFDADGNTAEQEITVTYSPPGQ